MSDYTPSTEEVREMYWECSGEPRRDSGAWAEFDRWFASVKAAAWREGYESGFGDGGVNAWDPENPYREENG